jgi:hypothetical protein
MRPRVEEGACVCGFDSPFFLLPLICVLIVWVDFRLMGNGRQLAVSLTAIS